MSDIKLSVTPAAGWLPRPAALFALCCVLLSPQLAQAQGALPFATSYSTTGDYVVGSVDLLPQQVVGNFVTGKIPMSGVPANADIIAAFLFWETLSPFVPSSVPDPLLPQIAESRFRGKPLTVWKARKKDLVDYAACWTSGSPSGSSVRSLRS